MTLFLALVYLLFFLSGGAALVYQVVWVRSLTLVFGGSHLAVTAVLSIFMSGLAIGGYTVGRRVDREPNPLRLYGFLELGIAASALVFAGLMRIYPSIYVVVAQGRENAPAYLTIVRLLFSVVALIVPTVLMGGTLPVLSRFVSRRPENLRNHLSLLYGINTLGSVAGAAIAGFFLLRVYSVGITLAVAIATNAAIGLVSLWLQSRLGPMPVAPEYDAPASTDTFTARLILWGIGLSGFCALGYEVLWTRVLTIAVGASVYGFTIILVAFLTGIALGSGAYAAVTKALRVTHDRRGSLVAWFGVTQIVIGVTALAVTVYLRDIPANTVRLQNYFAGDVLASFRSRMGASFALAFVYTVVPALFMGAAFPMAGDAIARQRRVIGRAVGEVLASNTIGAILGASISGLVMVHYLGIERSLQVLTVVNIGVGLAVVATLLQRRWVTAAAALCTVGAVTFLSVNQDALRIWDRKYFAIFRSNQPDAFRTPDMVREAVENTDVLYYAEGVESIVSVIRVKGGEQAFVTNGRVEASSHLQAQQIQYTLGHLPMLLARNPRQVLVVGMGSGMTAGATAVHPSTERVTLVEIEPKVFGVARTFEQYNHHVLDNPKVRVVVNDGRNFLLTTPQKFDVITADPIHPWFRGAGYLYASEYFKLASEHLAPGGVVAQWLPLYELTPHDVASVVKTFQQHFTYTMMWLTYFDSVIVGSNSPFVIDEAELDRRIAYPDVAEDLRRVRMGSATDFLSYFVMGGNGMKAFAKYGTLNTDDRLYLEFSAPFSIATPSLKAENIASIATCRESILPYLKPGATQAERDAQHLKWEFQLAAARVGDPALALLLAGRTGDPHFLSLLHKLGMEYAAYAPGQFLGTEYQSALALEPRLLQQSSFPVVGADGRASVFEMSAVLVPVSKTRASIMFVDNRARVVYGQSYVDNYDVGGLADRMAVDVMSAVRTAYEHEATAARAQNQQAPLATRAMSRIRGVIVSKVQRAQHAS